MCWVSKKYLRMPNKKCVWSSRCHRLCDHTFSWWVSTTKTLEFSLFLWCSKFFFDVLGLFVFWSFFVDVYFITYSTNWYNTQYHWVYLCRVPPSLAAQIQSEHSFDLTPRDAGTCTTSKIIFGANQSWINLTKCDFIAIKLAHSNPLLSDCEHHVKFRFLEFKQFWSSGVWFWRLRIMSF